MNYILKLKSTFLFRLIFAVAISLLLNSCFSQIQSYDGFEDYHDYMDYYEYYDDYYDHYR